LNESKFLKIAAIAVAAPLFFLVVGTLQSGNVGRGYLMALCMASTAIPFHLADWIERIDRTLRIRFLADRAVLFRVRVATTGSLVALAWAAGAALGAPAGAFGLKTALVVLGPVMASLALASLSISSALGRVHELVAAD